MDIAKKKNAVATAKGALKFAKIAVDMILVLFEQKQTLFFRFFSRKCNSFFGNKFLYYFKRGSSCEK